MSHSKLVNFRLIASICLLYIFHIVSIQSSFIAGSIAIVEFLVVVFFFAFKPKNFFYALLIILSGSFDVDEFVKSDNYIVYNVTYLPIVSGYVWIAFMLLLYYTKRFNKRLVQRISQKPEFHKFLKLTDYIIFCGLLIGIISITTNDNNILDINWSYYLFYDFIAYTTAPILGILLISDICVYGEKYVKKLMQILIAIMFSIPVSTLFTTAIGYKGTYGSGIILLSPLTLFLCCSIVFFALYKEYRMRFFALASFAMCMFLQLFYANALGGKSWLMILYVAIVLLMILYRKNYKKTVLIVVTLFIFVSGIALELIRAQAESNSRDNLAMNKLQQAIMLISFSDVLWYSNMPSSPKTRIEEFLNVSLEFKEKPQYALLGKGFAGSTQDHIRFTAYKGEAAFSDDQFDNHSFISLHETFNNVYLKFGIIGLIVLLTFISKLYKRLDNNPWGAIGAIWVILFYGYSIVLAIFGISCVVIALYYNSDKPLLQK